MNRRMLNEAELNYSSEEPDRYVRGIPKFQKKFGTKKPEQTGNMLGYIRADDYSNGAISSSEKSLEQQAEALKIAVDFERLLRESGGSVDSVKSVVDHAYNSILNSDADLNSVNFIFKLTKKLKGNDNYRYLADQIESEILDYASNYLEESYRRNKSVKSIFESLSTEDKKQVVNYMKRLKNR